jgi:hypothetical protein
MSSINAVLKGLGDSLECNKNLAFCIPAHQGGGVIGDICSTNLFQYFENSNPD